MCKKGSLCEAIKSYGKNQIKLMIFVKCIVLNWVILCSEMVNVSLFFSQDLTWRHNSLPALLSVLIPPHGVHIVISGERERNTKDEKQEKWRSSRKERMLFICHLFPSPHFFLMLFIFPHSHIISNAAAGADKLTHSELFGPENVCFTFW